MDIATAWLRPRKHTTTSPTIVYLHGARATSTSFNHLRQTLFAGASPRYREMPLEYDSANGFRKNLDVMKQQIDTAGANIYFVAHSLGGIYALHLAHEFPDRVLGAVTISTPYGGCSAATVLRYLVPGPLMWDISPDAAPMVFARRAEIAWPWTNVVSTLGHNALIAEENDGVVGLASMRYRRGDMALVEVASNHYEVVQHPDVVALVQERLLSTIPTRHNAA